MIGTGTAIFVPKQLYILAHSSINSSRVAVKRGSDLYHLHGDHLGSTSLTTDGAGVSTASRAYYAYGAERNSSGALQTDRTFTGQKRDSTGLMYYNARYYDPTLGAFISPDTLVPHPARVFDFNRFAYAGNNPLRYSDPTGHCLGPVSIVCALIAAAFILDGSVAEYPDPDAAPPPPMTVAEELAFGFLYGDITDFAILIPAYDPISQKPVPYFSEDWWVTAGFAALPVASGTTVRAVSRAAGVAAVAATSSRRTGSSYISALDDVVDGQAERHIGGSQLPTNLGTRLRSEARQIWEFANRKLKTDEQIHHRIPLEYAHLFPEADPNRLANLIMMLKTDHIEVTRAWRQFKTQHRQMGTIPTAAQVLEEAA